MLVSLQQRCSCCAHRTNHSRLNARTYVREYPPILVGVNQCRPNGKLVAGLFLTRCKALYTAPPRPAGSVAVPSHLHCRPAGWFLVLTGSHGVDHSCLGWWAAILLSLAFLGGWFRCWRPHDSDAWEVAGGRPAVATGLRRRSSVVVVVSLSVLMSLLLPLIQRWMLWPVSVLYRWWTIPRHR